MTVNPADSEIFGGLYGSDEMRGVFADTVLLQRMLDVEAALARVEARLGIIPAGAAAAISKAATLDKIDLKVIAAGARLAGYPAAALARALGKAAGGDAAKYVHWGATSQDIVDTAQVLQIRDGLALVERDLRALVAALAQQAEAHRNAVMAGRSFLQQALPITFGYKCAVWLSPFLDHLDRLKELRPRVLRAQLGGAVGTLASLGGKGRAVTVALAKELGLAALEAPWHVARDGIAETGGFLGLVAGSLAKLATDVMLLAQTEIAEVAEPAEAGRGGSSTMPQKRNPIASAYIVSAARGVHALLPLLFTAMAQDQERATGPWQSEQLALPQMFVLAAGALAHGVPLAAGLEVDAAKMRANLNLTEGLILSEAVMMALAEKIGRDAAHHQVAGAASRAAETRRPFAEVLRATPEIRKHLDDAALARALDPANYLGEAGAVIDRVLARARR